MSKGEDGVKETEHITTRRAVENYIQYSGRPFTIRDVVEMTGLNENTVAGYVRKFAHECKIKVVGKDVGGYKLYIKVSAQKRKHEKKPVKFFTDEEYERELEWARSTGII